MAPNGDTHTLHQHHPEVTNKRLLINRASPSYVLYGVGAHAERLGLVFARAADEHHACGELYVVSHVAMRLAGRIISWSSMGPLYAGEDAIVYCTNDGLTRQASVFGDFLLTSHSYNV